MFCGRVGLFNIKPEINSPFRDGFSSSSCFTRTPTWWTSLLFPFVLQTVGKFGKSQRKGEKRSKPHSRLRDPVMCLSVVLINVNNTIIGSIGVALWRNLGFSVTENLRTHANHNTTPMCFATGTLQNNRAHAHELAVLKTNNPIDGLAYTNTKQHLAKHAHIHILHSMCIPVTVLGYLQVDSVYQCSCGNIAYQCSTQL